MGISTHRRASLDVLLQEIEQHPEIIPEYAKLLIEMQSGAYEFMSVFGQPHRREINLEDALVFHRIYRWLKAGDLFLHRVFIGEGAKQNRFTKSINDTLATLPYPYKASFDGNGDYDGRFEWLSSIVFETDTISICQDTIEIKPVWAPLEVGSTDFETTFFHLLQFGVLARWPYHDFSITIISFPEHQRVFDRIFETG